MKNKIIKNTIESQNSEWVNIGRQIIQYHGQLRKMLTNDDLRIRFQFLCIFVIFSLVSLFMTVANVITEWHLLTLLTLFFAIANIINSMLVLINPFTEKLAQFLFSLEIIFLFTAFIIFGEPEGFSAIWAALLPACGLLLYQTKNGTILSVIQFLILIFLFWIPAGRNLLQYEYTHSFLLRFPLLFFAFYMVGLFFETILSLTQKELSSLRDRYKHLYIHDALTGVFNRYGFTQLMDNFNNNSDNSEYAFAMIDIDNFKHINDNFGHYNGDLVIKEVSADISRIVGDNAEVCRWGGDEFAIFFHNISNAEDLCQELLKSRQKHIFSFYNQNISVTISIGLLIVPTGISIPVSSVLNLADKKLYESKCTGKNRINVHTLSQEEFGPIDSVNND